MRMDDTKPLENEVIEAPKLTVETFQNHVYFYADVSTDQVLNLVKQLKQVDDMLRNEQLSRDIPKNAITPIWLHVQSGGGSLFAGFSAADQIARIKTPVYSIVEGYCASAATLISLTCTRRFILPNAFILIHQLSGFTWGTYEQMKDDMHLSDMAMDKIVGFYVARTGMKEKKIRKLLKRDSWFNAEEAIEIGLADEILKD